MGRSEITSILRDITQDSRLTLHWHPLEDMSRSEIQLVFLAIQCAEQALPYGDRVDINRQQDRWTLELHSDRIMIDDSIWSAFRSTNTSGCTGEIPPQNAIIPAHVQFLLLPINAAALGRSVSISQTEQTVTLLV